MTIGRLLVVMGVDDTQMRRGLAQSASNIEGFSHAVDNLGHSLLRNVTGPLALLGGASLRSTANLDMLMKELEATTGGAAEAAATLRRLTAAAKLPGIDLEGAIKTTAVLRGIGFTAAGAERAIYGIGKAVAASGGGAEEFRNVARQFRQVASLGRLMGEELNVIVENAPAAAAAIQKAFGTTNATAIRAMNLTTEQFFDKLLGGFESLPRVSGSLGNSFENLGTAIRQAIGLQTREDLNSLITTVDELTSHVEAMGLAWRRLPTEQRHQIVQLGLALVALGPGIRVIGMLVSALATLRLAMRAFAASNAAYLITSIRSIPDAVAAAQLALGALIPTVGTLLVIAVAAAAAAWVKFRIEAVKAATEAAAAINKYQASIADMSQTEALREMNRQREALRLWRDEVKRLEDTQPKPILTRAGFVANDEEIQKHGELLANARKQVDGYAAQLDVAARGFSDAKERARELKKIMDDTMGNRIPSVGKAKTPLQLAQEQAGALADNLKTIPTFTSKWVQALFKAVDLQKEFLALADAQKDQFGPIAAGYRKLADELRDATGIEPGQTVVEFDVKAFEQGQLDMVKRLTTPVQLKIQKVESTGFAKMSAADLEEFRRRLDPVYDALRTTEEEIYQFGHAVQVGWFQLKQQFEHPGNTAAQALNMLGDAGLQLINQLTPLGLVAAVIAGAMEVLQPAIDAVLMPLTILGEVLGKALIPIIKLLYPPIQHLAIGATYVAQVFFTVASWLYKGIGYVVKGIGALIDKIPGLGDFGLKKKGQEMIDLGNSFAQSAKEMARTREELKNMSFEDALDRATNGLNKLTDAVAGAVQGYKYAAVRYDVIEPTASGRGARPRGPAAPAGEGTTIIQGGSLTMPVTIKTSGDGRETYRNWYDEVDRRSRGNPQMRAWFNTLAKPS